MSTFKKMMLLSQEEMERIKARQIKEYDPSLTALARIQDQLDTVLNDPVLAKAPPDERLKLFQKLQHRFGQIKHEGDTPIKLAGVETSMPEPPAPQPAPTPPSTTPLPGLPVQMLGVNKRYRTHADRLMKHIFRDPSTLTANDRLELVVKGQPVPGSNVVDLVSDVFATAKSRVEGPRPEGFEEFVSALKDVNAPHTLLVNPKYSDSLASSSSYSNPFSALSVPKRMKHSLKVNRLHKFQHPSKSPHVLSLYRV